MSEPSVIIAISACITVVIIAILFFIFLLLRGRQLVHREEETSGHTLRNDIDGAADAALEEINKTARLISDELTEKYQAMLFLYNLLEEKKKEFAVLLEAAPPAAPIKPAAKPRRIRENPKQNKVIALHQEGLALPEIAKSLNIGQGEVKLILDLAGR